MFYGKRNHPAYIFHFFSQEKALRKLHDIAFWGIELRILLREKNMQLTILYYMDLYKPYIPSPCNQNIFLSLQLLQKSIIIKNMTSLWTSAKLFSYIYSCRPQLIVWIIDENQKVNNSKSRLFWNEGGIGIFRIFKIFGTEILP